MEERRRAAYNVCWCEAHPRANLVAIIEDGAVREAGCFGYGGRPRCELDIDNVIIGEELDGERAGRRAVEKFMEGSSRSEVGGINGIRAFLDKNQVLKTGNGGRLKIRASQIGDHLLQQWNIGTRWFER